MAVPSGTFWIAIAAMTNALSPTTSDANALPIAKPSGRLWTKSTPSTSSERAPASLRPPSPVRRPSARRESRSASAPAARGERDGRAVPAIEGRQQQPDGRGDRHHAGREPAQQALGAAGAGLAEDDDRQRADPGREHGRGRHQREQQDVGHGRTVSGATAAAPIRTLPQTRAGISAAARMGRGFQGMDARQTAMDEHLDEQRLRRLIDVGRGLLSQLDLEAVLDQVLETAREITGARYAALGVLDRERRELERFITRGIDAETHRAIGDLPRGRGILGVLIDEPAAAAHRRRRRASEVLRLPARAIRRWRASSACRSQVRGQVWGNLYLTEKSGGVEFDAVDEESVVDPRRVGGDRDRERPPVRGGQRPAATSSSTPRGAWRRRARSPSRSAPRWSSSTSSSSSPSAAGRSSRRAAS